MPPRKRLGQLLTELKMIDEHQLQSALGHQKQWGGKLGTILVQKGFCKEDQVVTALSQHLAMPAVRLADAKIDPRAVKTVSKTVAEKLHVFAYEVTGSGRSEVITIAMSDPTDLSAVDQLAFHTGKRIKPMLAGDSEVVAAIQQHYASDKPKEEAPPSVPPGSRPLVSPLAGGRAAAPGVAARLTPSAPMPAVAAPGGAQMTTPLMVKRAERARPPASPSSPVAVPAAAPVINGAAAPMEPVGIEGDDLPPDAPMEGLEPIAAHTQGGQSVEGSEEVAGQGAAGDAVAGLEAVNPHEAVGSVEVQKMDELEPAVRPQEAGPAPADSSAAEAPPLEDQAALQGWAEVQKEGVDLHPENPAPPPPPAEGGWSEAPAQWSAAPAEEAVDTLADELPMDAIMGTADVLEGGAEELAAEAPAAWNEVADPLAAPAAEAEAPAPAPAPPPEPPAGAPAGWSEPSAAEAASDWGVPAESSWDPSPPPAEEPSPEQPAPEQEWAQRAAAEVQAAAEETASDSWGAPEPSMSPEPSMASPEEASVAAAEDVPPEQQAAEETYVESANTQEFAMAEPPAAAEGGPFEESLAEEAAVAEESPAPESWSGGEEQPAYAEQPEEQQQIQEGEQQPTQVEGWVAPPAEPEQEGTGWFGEALAATSPLSTADLGTLAALGLDPADGVGALRFLACLVRVLNRHASIDAEELAAEIRESRIAGAAAAQEMEQAEAQPADGAEQAADAASEAAEAEPAQEEAGTARDPWTGSHES